MCNGLFMWMLCLCTLWYLCVNMLCCIHLCLSMCKWMSVYVCVCRFSCILYFVTAMCYCLSVHTNMRTICVTNLALPSPKRCKRYSHNKPNKTQFVKSIFEKLWKFWKCYEREWIIPIMQYNELAFRYVTIKTLKRKFRTFYKENIHPHS